MTRPGLSVCAISSRKALLPLGGYSFAVSSLQLHPVFGGISK